MINRLSEFWDSWKNTSIGKAAEDFFWTVVYSSVAVGLSAVVPTLMGGATDPRVVWGVFYAGLSVAFLKSVSVFVDKYRHGRVPTTPQE
jgi:hypothetical protein